MIGKPELFCFSRESSNHIMTNEKPLSPKNDYVFKKIFSEKMLALADFLQKVLELPAEEYGRLEIVDPNLLPESLDNKHCILDIKLYTKSGNVINIEIQVKYQTNIWKRIQYYNAKLLAEQSKSKGKYKEIPQVITILIADFVLIQENETYHHRFRFYDEKTKVRYPDSTEINILEIPKVNKEDQTDLGNWMRFFAAEEEEEFEMLAQTNPAIAEAWGVIKHLSADESARLIAESREKARMDIDSWIADALEEGEQKGRQEGEQKKAYAIAGNLLRKKMPLSDIVDATGLPFEEVRRISAELSK
jgi:predicted transposase/invertase (TIGR01784 family)